MAKRPETAPDRKMAAALLEELWQVVLNDETLKASDAVGALVNHDQVAIRFCLPTQLLGKLTDHALDALSLQKGDGSDNRWDPRGFASRVIVPWNRKNQSVLGGSGDPYVGNPLRRPRIDSGLDQMDDRAAWDALVEVLQDVQDRNDPEHTKRIFLETLAAIRERLAELSFLYVIPSRVSLAQTKNLALAFLSEKSGGDRGLALAAALFETLKERLNVYHEVRRGMINAADAATGAVGDLECLDAAGNIRVAVEVKERRLKTEDIHSAVAKAREFNVKELIFCSEGFVTAEADATQRAIDSAWASGTNVYQVTIDGLLMYTLPILGEEGVKSFVTHVGWQLDRFNTQPRHRKAWKALLDKL